MLAMQERHIVNKNVSKKRPIYLQTAVFTPLSIRRGGGGEAVVGLVVSLLLAGDRLSLGLCCACFYSHLITIKGEGRALFDSYDR